MSVAMIRRCLNIRFTNMQTKRDHTAALIYLEHYKIMKQEVFQNSSESFRALQIAILIVSTLLTLASTSIISSEIRWLFFLFPAVAASPFIMLIAQRFRQTRRIGKYIALQIEPKLGFSWENLGPQPISLIYELTKKSKKTWRITPLSVVAMSLPLGIIQLLSWFASFYFLSSLPFQTFAHSIIVWTIWLVISAMIVFLVIFEYHVLKDSAIKESLKESAIIDSFQKIKEKSMKK